MTINQVTQIDNLVRVKQALISVSDKSNLETFIPKLLEAAPGVKIFSTGGTFARLKEILGSVANNHLTQVSEYTGQPETQGGLVKTLDFKIYLGLLTETYNDAHQADLARTAATAIDLVVVNLYPFHATIAKEGVSPEMARGNIDIGGPCMIRASAKNFLRVASVVDPADYPSLWEEIETNNGATSMALRFKLARKAFAHTADYDQAISAYLAKQSFTGVADCYQ